MDSLKFWKHLFGWFSSSNQGDLQLSTIHDCPFLSHNPTSHQDEVFKISLEFRLNLESFFRNSERVWPCSLGSDPSYRIWFLNLVDSVLARDLSIFRINSFLLGFEFARGVTVWLTAVFGKKVNQTVCHGFWFLKTVTVTVTVTVTEPWKIESRLTIQLRLIFTLKNLWKFSDLPIKLTMKKKKKTIVR